MTTPPTIDILADFLDLIRKGRVQSVHDMWQYFNIDINSQDMYGNTPLHAACIKGNQEIVRFLLDNGGCPDIQEPSGNTPLHLAAWRNHVEVVRMLAEHSKNIDCGNSEDNSALTWAAAYGHTNVCEILLNNGADINHINRHGDTPLHRAAKFGFLSTVNLLLESKANIKGRNNDGFTPLHMAAQCDDNWHKESYSVECATLLIEHGAEINSQCNEGLTPLLIASRSGNPPLIYKLLSSGADIIFRDKKEGNSVLHMATEKLLGRKPAHKGQRDAVSLYVDGNYIDINVRNDKGQTALHQAVRNGKLDMVSLLIEKGIDVNTRDIEGRTALHEATFTLENTNKDILEILLKHQLDINSRDIEGRTALHLAAEFLNVEAVKVLLENQVEINIYDTQEKTPLHRACDSINRKFTHPHEDLMKAMEARRATHAFFEGLPSINRNFRYGRRGALCLNQNDASKEENDMSILTLFLEDGAIMPEHVYTEKVNALLQKHETKRCLRKLLFMKETDQTTFGGKILIENYDIKRLISGWL